MSTESSQRESTTKTRLSCMRGRDGDEGCLRASTVSGALVARDLVRPPSRSARVFWCTSHTRLVCVPMHSNSCDILLVFALSGQFQVCRHGGRSELRASAPARCRRPMQARQPWTLHDPEVGLQSTVCPFDHLEMDGLRRVPVAVKLRTPSQGCGRFRRAARLFCKVGGSLWPRVRRDE